MSQVTDAALAEIQEPNELNELETIRHSCAHVMAHAISQLWPDAKFGIGPTVEDGFYYDIDMAHKLTTDDLKSIEKAMFKIINQNNAFVRSEHTIPEAIEMFKGMNQPFKVEIISDLRDKFGATSVSTYKEGDFVDLCRGPHIEKTQKIKAFQLTSIAGAYWRGSEKNPMLQRIYGTAFLSKEALHEHMQLIEEAKRRDHRKLGKELELFTFIPQAPASPFFLPKGTVVYNRLVEYVRNMYRYYKYDEVITPQIFDTVLWKTSGHYDNYKENMYFTKFNHEGIKKDDQDKEADEREFGVKPMNCPAHTYVFANSKRSYRELPMRIADFGRLHRYEKSGVTAGLTRVRTFCQDDAHVFCTLDQVEKEIGIVVEMIEKTYTVFDFDLSGMQVFLSTRPEKRMLTDEVWDQAEGALKAILDKMGRPYKINPGDGAFYGPKIDFKFKDALKRDWQLATIQLDFSMPEKFELEYTGADNAPHRPVMIHRAVLGSLERFMGVMIEHFAGAFPFWLAPVQVRLIPIMETHIEFCNEFGKKLQRLGIRFDMDARNEKMGLKTREAQMQKIPLMLVAGDREMADGQFAVRKYGAQASEVMSLDAIIDMLIELNSVPTKPFQV